MSAPRWCIWCGGVVYAGSHHKDGSFDPYSVPVSDAEIKAALKRNWEWRSRTVVHFNIALGKHSGSYQVEKEGHPPCPVEGLAASVSTPYGRERLPIG